METHSVPVLYRVEGLSSFGEQDQIKLYGEALESAKVSIWTRCAVFFWVALCLALVYLLRSGPLLEVAILAVVGILGNMAIMVLRVRIELRRLSKLGSGSSGPRGAAS